MAEGMSLLRWYSIGKDKDTRTLQHVKISIDGQIPQVSDANPGAKIPPKPVKAKWEGSIETYWILAPIAVSINMTATHLSHRTFSIEGGAFKIKGATIGDLIFDLRSIQKQECKKREFTFEIYQAPDLRMLSIPNPFQGTLNIKLDKDDADFLSKNLEIVAKSTDWMKKDRCGLCRGLKTMGAIGNTSDFGQVCPQCMQIWSFIMMPAGEFLRRFMNRDEEAGNALFGSSMILKEIATKMPVVDEALKAEFKYIQGAFVLTFTMSHAKDPANVLEDPQARQNIQKAREMLKDAYDISKKLNDPETISIYGYQLARAAQTLKDHEMTIPLFEEGFTIDLQNKDPENVAKAALDLMRIYADAGRHEDVWTTYQKAATIPGFDGLSTHHLPAIFDIALRSAIQTANAERFAIALEASKKSCTPEHGGATAAQSRELEYTGKWHEARGNLPEARSSYTQLLALFKQENLPAISTSRVARKIKALDAAIQGVPFVDQETPEEWFANAKGLETYAQKLAYFQAGLQKGPEFHATALKGIGVIYMVDNNAQEASRAFEQSLECDPTNGDVWYMLGTAKISLKDMSGVGTAFRKSIECDSTNKQRIWNFASDSASQVTKLVPALKALGNQAAHFILQGWGIDDLFSGM